MDSEGEETEVRSNFSWVVTVGDGLAAPTNEVLAKDNGASTKGSSNESCVENLVSGEGVISASKTTNAYQDYTSPVMTKSETSSENGATSSGKPPINPVFDVEIPNDSKLISFETNDHGIEKSEGENEDYLAPINVPEKIILCFDLSEDHFYLSSKYSEVNDLSTLNVIKQAIEMFIHSKHMIDNRHEFSLVVVHQKAVWLQDFTNNLKDILTVLSELTETPPSDSFCLTSLFDVIKENVHLPTASNSANIPPPYVIRPIIIYSRCQCVPKFNDGWESFHDLMSSKYFGFDFIAIHESLSPDNSQSDEIAKVFEDMCSKSWSLKLHVSRSATKVLDSMAKLLSHPLQRRKGSDFKALIGNSCLVDSNGIQ